MYSVGVIPEASKGKVVLAGDYSAHEDEPNHLTRIPISMVLVARALEKKAYLLGWIVRINLIGQTAVPLSSISLK